MGSPVNINSTAEWSALLSSTSVVVVDFYADWCGPCKMIAPAFANLAKEHSSPKHMAFAKVNVDNQPEIAQAQGVTAMPTFKVFHQGTCIETLKGANPSALTAAVMKGKSLAGNAAVGSGDVFKTPGRTLAGAAKPRGSGRPFSWYIETFVQTVITFVGLYFISFFTTNAFGSAQQSSFNVFTNPKMTKHGVWQGNGRYVSPQAAKPTSRFSTLSDLKKSE